MTQSMDILPTNFKILQFCGAWQERGDDNVFIRFLRFCYKYVIFFLIHEYTVLVMIEIVRTRDRVHELTQRLALGLTFLTLSMKYANFLLRGKELSALLDCLRVKMCQPRNTMEKLIVKEHHRKVKWSTFSFIIISFMTGLGFTIVSIIRLIKNGEHVLPLEAYTPYPISDLLPYLLTYLQQCIMIFYAVLLNISFDSLVYGFTIHACAQIELIRRRLMNSSSRSADLTSSARKSSRARTLTIDECVQHHLLVRTLVRETRRIFIWMIMSLFFSCSIILCTSVFQLSKNKLLSFEFFSMLLYLSGISMQLFVYCWYGNELELKSKSIATAIYFSNWTIASPRERRLLLLIMINSQKGLTISYHGVFSMSLNSFTKICRASYSAFNILQQASS